MQRCVPVTGDLQGPEGGGGLRVRIACGPRVVVCQEPEGDFGGGDGKVVRL